MNRKKRPYFTLVVFATLLVFILFLAWQSNAFRQQMAETRLQPGGRTLFLPLAGDIPCTGRGCPGSPYPAPAYPALDNTSPAKGLAPQSAQRSQSERTLPRFSLWSPRSLW